MAEANITRPAGDPYKLTQQQVSATSDSDAFFYSLVRIDSDSS
jgi:hypothetical protein